MPNQIYSMDWNDTFLNEDHLRASFPSHRVQIELKTPTIKPVPPFRLETEKPPEKAQKQNDSSEVKMEVSISAVHSCTILSLMIIFVYLQML